MNKNKPKMFDIIMQSPAQFSKGYAAAGNTGSALRGKPFKQIVVAGMGGSGLPGELLTLFSKQLNISIPITIHKDYGLPDGINDNALVVVISYSGNTEEALSSYAEVLKTKIPFAVITSGGKLKEFATSNGIPLIQIPDKIQPRLALGYQFSALLALLANAGIVNSQKKVMANLSNLDAEKMRKAGEKLAKKIGNNTPLFYSVKQLAPLAYILKIQINENAKRHAFCNVFPELNHNELVGFETSGPFFVVILKYNASHPRNARRMLLTAKTLEKRGFAVEYIDLKESSCYNDVFYTILLGNWTSYYLALTSNIDPEAVTIVEEFKKKL